MKLVHATNEDRNKILRAIGQKNINYITNEKVRNDYELGQLYVVKEGNKVLATVSLVREIEYNYYAIKRLCVLNKGNCGKGIGSFAVRELSKAVSGKRVGATPWTDNIAMRNLLESEGYQLQYVFNERWCFYAKD